MSVNRIEQRQQLREKWTALLQDWQTSQLSVIEWCRQQNIPTHRFHYWKRKLVIATAGKIAPESFLEITDESGSAGIEICYKDISIRPTRGFDATTLVKCLQLLRNF